MNGLDGLELVLLLWVATQTVFMLTCWARVETRMGQLARSLRQLWKSHDQLHPRRGNPGEVESHHGHDHGEGDDADLSP